MLLVSTPHLAPAPAVDELVTSHLPLVAHLVRELAGRLPHHVSRDDLTSAGMVALVQAARGFDPERGVAFAGFASTRVRGALLDELRGIDWASRSVRRRARDLDRVRTELVETLGRAATDQEVAQAAGLTVEQVRRNGDDVDRARVVSIHGSDDHDVEDLLPSGGPTPEQVVQRREEMAYMTAAVAHLPERLRVVVEQYFLHERPMAEIAETLGVSESRVSQMRAEALVLMRGALDRTLGTVVTTGAPAAGCAARRKESYYASVAASVHRGSGPRLVGAVSA